MASPLVRIRFDASSLTWRLVSRADETIFHLRPTFPVIATDARQLDYSSSTAAQVNVGTKPAREGSPTSERGPLLQTSPAANLGACPLGQRARGAAHRPSLPGIEGPLTGPHPLADIEADNKERLDHEVSRSRRLCPRVLALIPFAAASTSHAQMPLVLLPPSVWSSHHALSLLSSEGEEMEAMLGRIATSSYGSGKQLTFPCPPTRRSSHHPIPPIFRL